MHPWKFACKRGQFTAVDVDATAPLWGWSYRHELPVACVRLLSVDPEMDYNLEGRFIYSNAQEYNFRYIEEVTVYEDYDPACYEGVAHHLAWIICFALTQSLSLKDQIFKDMVTIIKQGRFVDSTEENSKMFNSDVWLPARDSSANFIRDPLT